jgi:flavin-binding protein dodecin
VRTRVAAAALAMLLGTVATGCSDEADQAVDDAADRASELAGQGVDELEGQLDDAELPKVDWGQYGDRLRNRLDQLSEQANCKGLRKELAKAESDDTELTQYIKRQIARVC